MAGKSGTIHATLLKRATRRTGNRCRTIHTTLDPDELRRFEAWRATRGLTTAQGIRYLILCANAFHATQKHQAKRADTPISGQITA